MAVHCQKSGSGGCSPPCTMHCDPIHIVLILLVQIVVTLAFSFGLLDSITSVVRCGFKYNHEVGDACPKRCQFLYMECLPPEHLFTGCRCKDGYIFDFDMQRCISEESCKELEGADHDFIVQQVHNKARGYNISCDLMNYCDLRNLRKKDDKVVDEGKQPCSKIDDQTVYWRGDQSDEIYYKGTTLSDCDRITEKSQNYMLSLRRIWEEDYKDELD